MVPTSTNLWPFFTFFGGKWRAAPRYPRPAWGTIIEPFAGSAGYALRYPSRQVVLVERDPVIAETWRYLLTATSTEIRNLPLNVSNTDDLVLPEGARHLIGFWLNKGTTGPCRMPSAWMRSGIRPNSQWGEAIRERIASQVDQIRHWQLVEGDYTKAPNIPATWFIDPPYVGAGRSYRFGSRQLDYSDLAKWCRSRAGQVMVCENTGADWLPFRPFMAIKSTSGRQRTGVSDEALWSNDG